MKGAAAFVVMLLVGFLVGWLLRPSAAGGQRMQSPGWHLLEVRPEPRPNTRGPIATLHAAERGFPTSYPFHAPSSRRTMMSSPM